MTDTRHYLDTLSEATRTWNHWQENAQSLIDKYGDTEVSSVFCDEVRRLAALNINLIEDEACDNSELWLKRVVEQQAKTILMEAHEAVTGDIIDVTGGKSAKELSVLRTQIIRCYNEFGRLMIKYDKPDKKSNKQKTAKFIDIIQYHDKRKLLDRLHFLMDGKRGADVGAVLLKAQQDGLLVRIPTQAEYKSEFELIGGWSAIHNYMSDNNQNALDKANKIIIF
nr:hypothetical protein [Hoylesella enoeca]